MGIKHTHCKRGHPLTPENRNHRGKCKSCTKLTAAVYQKKYYEQHPDFCKYNHIRVAYGLSREEYDQMFEEQKGLCAICKRIMAEPHVDHDHETNQVRRLLCGGCNKGIGLLQEDILILESAIEYLRKWKV